MVLLYAFGLHLAAGGVAGSAFQIRTLLVLAVVVAFEAACVAFLRGGVAAPWLLISLAGLQFGYLAGVLGRGAVEHAANAGVRPRHLP